jgi:hypothetical protein
MGKASSTCGKYIASAPSKARATQCNILDNHSAHRRRKGLQSCRRQPAALLQKGVAHVVDVLRTSIPVCTLFPCDG